MNGFSSALDFILHSRPSHNGGAEIGGAHLLPMVWNQIELTAISLALASFVAIPTGLVLGHIGRGQFLATTIANVGRAVPSLALIGLFVAYLGVGFRNITLALILLAIPPILMNTYVGIRQVDPISIDAARGMGLSRWQILTQLQLPLALPLIFTGVRISLVNVIATATIAPLAGVATLGEPIIAVGVYGQNGRFGAAILVALIAIAAEVVFLLIQKLVTPRGIILSNTKKFTRNRATRVTA